MTKSISDIIHNDYRDYSLYVLQNRAIPSVVDGLKPSQRKALYTALRYARNNVKTVSLIGRTIADGKYHHGDASLSGAVSLMAATWNNNVPLFHGEGSFGSRLAPTPAAARYTSIRLSKDFDKYFRDNEILEEQHDPENPEPKFYLPLIPWVLVNGVKGIAVGFATEIQPRAPKDLIKACKAYLETGVLPNRIKPTLPEFNGKILLDRKKDLWYCEGLWNLKSKTQLEITELPYGVPRAKFVELLDKLEDNGDIATYYDYCDKSGFKFDIRLKRGGKQIADAKIVQMFKLRSYLNENFTTIDEHGEVLVFDSEVELLKYFCDLRLQYVDKRLQYLIKRDSEALRFSQVKLDFISRVLSGDLTFIGVDVQGLKKNALSSVSDVLEEDLDKLVKITAGQFCSDSVQQLEDKIAGLKADIKANQSRTARDVYTKDLEEL